VLKNEIPACEDWTPVFIFPKLVKVIAQVSGRIFVGSELCHDKDYLDTAINYTTELIDAMKAIKRMNPWLRPFLASRLPQVQRVNEREELAVKFFEPIVQARREAAKNPDYQKPDDMLQWFLNRSDQCKSQSLRHIVKMQLLMIFAGIHNTTVTTTNILYNLAVTPDYIPPLREEIQTVIGDNGGVLTSRALQQLEKLDSYMKETLRFHPPEITSFSRQAVGGITLSNGQYIPSGSFIETPAHAIYQDNATFPDSDTFDGFRFYKIRQGGSAALGARNQFVTSNEQNLVFGYGKHACPGRFLAAAEIKMILSKILLEYDFKVVGDETKRYQNYELGRVVSTAKALTYPNGQLNRDRLYLK
jgi:cytochrome P450